MQIQYYCSYTYNILLEQYEKSKRVFLLKMYTPIYQRGHTNNGSSLTFNKTILKSFRNKELRLYPSLPTSKNPRFIHVTKLSSEMK